MCLENYDSFKFLRRSLTNFIMMCFLNFVLKDDHFFEYKIYSKVSCNSIYRLKIRYTDGFFEN